MAHARQFRRVASIEFDYTLRYRSDFEPNWQIAEVHLVLVGGINHEGMNSDGAHRQTAFRYREGEREATGTELAVAVDARPRRHVKKWTRSGHILDYDDSGRDSIQLTTVAKFPHSAANLHHLDPKSEHDYLRMDGATRHDDERVTFRFVVAKTNAHLTLTCNPNAGWMPEIIEFVSEWRGTSGSDPPVSFRDVTRNEFANVAPTDAEPLFYPVRGQNFSARGAGDLELKEEYTVELESVAFGRTYPDDVFALDPRPGDVVFDATTNEPIARYAHLAKMTPEPGPTDTGESPSATGNARALGQTLDAAVPARQPDGIPPPYDVGPNWWMYGGLAVGGLLAGSGLLLLLFQRLRA